MVGIAHITAQYHDLTLLQASSPGEQRQQAGLAHPVGADQADHLAGRKVQTDIVQGEDFAVALGYPRDAGDLSCLLRTHGVTRISRVSGQLAASSSFR